MGPHAAPTPPEPTSASSLVVPDAVARALLEGEQVVDLRTEPPPAGITRFWLCPTGGSPELKPAYRIARDLSQPGEPVAPGQVRIEGWAELAGVGRTALDDAGVAALDGKTVLALRPEGGETVVLALRAHRLVEPLTVDGDLAGLPADPATRPSEPALSDVAFAARRDGLAEALPGGLA